MLEFIYLAIAIFGVGVIVLVYQMKLRKKEAAWKKDESMVQDLQHKLQIKEYQINEAQRVGAIGSFIWNLQDNAIILSEEMYRLCGRDPKNEKLTVAEFIAYIHPDDRQTVQIKLSDAAHGTEPFVHTF